jgi:hypothetical protein
LPLRASQKYVIAATPWKIDDKPRFQHREVLLDSSRHFEPVATIKNVIDSLVYAKLNGAGCCATLCCATLCCATLCCACLHLFASFSQLSSLSFFSTGTGTAIIF